MQLTQEAFSLRTVLRDIEEVRRDLLHLGGTNRSRWERHFAVLCRMQRELRADWPEEAAQIEAWEAERHQDVDFAL